MQVEKNPLPPSITRIVEHSTGKLVLSAATLTGGFVANTKHVVLSDGSQVVVKISKEASENLEIEGAMMAYLEQHSELPMPKLYYSGQDLLIHEFIPADGTLSEGAEAEAAEHLAKLHDITAEAYGFEYDTIVTGLHQPNTQMRKWLPFFTENRLLYAATHALAEGKLPAGMMSRIENLAGKIDHYLDEPPKPSLVHGDIWATTILCYDGKVKAFVDPAVYYGDSEIEFTFSTKNSTLGKPFFDRYNEIRPFRPGYFESRRYIYNLYPLLVHVRLFGEAYVPRIDAILSRFGF